MLNNIFKIIFLAEFITISIVRGIYTSRYKSQKMTEDDSDRGNIFLLKLTGIGMVIPLLYLFSPWLKFADYSLPIWVGWIGTMIFALAIIVLWRSHADLGRNWTIIPGIRDDHKLITNGIYKYIRHPMYAAHFLWAIAQVLMLHNWIAGFSFIVTLIPFYLDRVNHEEKVMFDKFGDEYKEYMNKSGRVFPKII